MSTVKDRLIEILSERYLKERYTISPQEYEDLSPEEKSKAWEPVHSGSSLIGYLEPLPDWEDRQAYWEWEQVNLWILLEE